MEQQQEKTCENCKHFVQHYRIHYTTFHQLNCGHCVKRKTHKKQQCSPLLKGCDSWEINNRKAERNERIETELRKMANKIDEILQILNIGK